ncbi:E3 ubiquitin-protein ligase Os04g0590900 [Dendrobium catenatum]|uniref:E3 ubiquitin-protein ligase Os04g0590900 n=1 Tax=Dendrobium catenatum TaxID=906689 RepID=UPI0009F491A8|nr:E3 ubiquitin-protein ligase Os04g0590900 [Dendrobium catenatum]
MTSPFRAFMAALLVSEELCTEIDCVICLCKIRRAKETAPLRCRHAFHKQCLDGWMKKSKRTTCPLCRDNLIVGGSSETKNDEGEDGGLIRSHNIIIISPFIRGGRGQAEVQRQSAAEQWSDKGQAEVQRRSLTGRRSGGDR